jgi:protein gp37
VRFISAEPLLEDVDLTPHLHGDTLAAPGPSGFRKGPRLDWVIVGGESGPGARPFCLSWARNIVHDCADAGVGCFVKQLGTVPYETTPEDGWDGVCQWPIETRLQLRDRKGGDLTEWPEDLRVREWPAR